ncbi:addiction module protein [Nitrospirillum viridazoti]|uniref:Addiction module component, tigr02574 family protein n=1 Tax=Nitrospirillum viridazoti CBAmc TaxID=1441467 RepID=A0A248JRQ1_9PROT|nr:addiction module protein [Nitrospirillum amazonense]ASG21200.1 addiction module component, tigr02574 family protein [Nitrospirillum amazonense CBAmc]TWB32195.1 putative addiction module component (TIGR02574 family) [Nitrospirillum amazonense]
MATIDYSHMTPAEKLALIGEIWESIEADAIPLTEAQAAEIRRRLETLDDDIRHGMDADALEAELDRRFP